MCMRETERDRERERRCRRRKRRLKGEEEQEEGRERGKKILRAPICTFCVLYLDVFCVLYPSVNRGSIAGYER